VQLGEAGGGEGSVWVGAEDSPALGGFAPIPADRQRFLQLVQQYRDANAVAVSWFRKPLRGARLGAVRFKVVVRDHLEADADAHHQDRREARNCFNEGGVRILFSVTDAAARSMVFSRQQPSGELLELFRSTAPLVIMDKEAAGSGGCSSTFHGRLGAGVTISIDAVPGVFNSGLTKQHPICRSLFSGKGGVQGNSNATTTAAASAAWSEKAVQQVYERFETACDDLDSGLFDLEPELETSRCMACSYQVHGLGKHGGQHPEFATTARPNNRCSGCSGCSY
jgi:hypothetical protein